MIPAVHHSETPTRFSESPFIYTGICLRYQNSYLTTLHKFALVVSGFWMV